MVLRRIIVAGLLVFLLSSVAAVASEIYVYVDAKGNYHFSTYKVDKRYRRVRLWKNKHFVRDLDAGKYDSFIVRMGRKYKIDPPLIKAVIKAESAWNPQAKSRAGAQGLMQLMPGTAKKLSVEDAFDPAQNIEAGTRYLRMMLDNFNGDLVLALAAYNAGPGAVKKYKGVPPYKETRDYIKRVLRYYREYLAK